MLLDPASSVGKVCIALLVVSFCAGTPASLFAQLGQANYDLRILPIEGNEETPRGVPLGERNLVIQVQDVSRGPIEGAEVTLTFVQNDTGIFPGGARTMKTTTDSEGLATVRIQPLKSKFIIRAEARYQGYSANSTINVGGASGSSKKWFVIGGLAGAAAISAFLGGRKSGTDTIPVTITTGTPRVDAP